MPLVRSDEVIAVIIFAVPVTVNFVDTLALL
jgi:hypothetical protein